MLSPNLAIICSQNISSPFMGWFLSSNLVNPLIDQYLIMLGIRKTTFFVFTLLDCTQSDQTLFFLKVLDIDPTCILPSETAIFIVNIGMSSVPCPVLLPY